MRKTFGPREAVATFLSEDFADMKDREYQSGRTGATTVYSYGNDYVFALPAGRNPSKALRDAFPDCRIAKAFGANADHCLAQGKQIWIIKQ